MPQKHVSIYSSIKMLMKDTYGPAKVTSCKVASLSGKENMDIMDFPGRKILMAISLQIVGNDDDCRCGRGNVVVDIVVSIPLGYMLLLL